MKTIEEIDKEIETLRVQLSEVRNRIENLQAERQKLICSDLRSQPIEFFLKGRTSSYGRFGRALADKGINTVGELIDANLSVVDLLVLPKCSKKSVNDLRRILWKEFGFEFLENRALEIKLMYR